MSGALIDRVMGRKRVESGHSSDAFEILHCQTIRRRDD